MVAMKTASKERSALPRKGKKTVEDHSDDNSSSDDDSVEVEAKAASSTSNSKAPPKKKTTITKARKANKNYTVVPNVIYIGHLPKDCQEQELINFLKQFGGLSQLRVCRSPQTGVSKGYAFAKFQDQEVAAVVADTLNGYMLFSKKLVSHVLAPEQIHAKLFASKTRTVFQRRSFRAAPPKSAEKIAEISKRLIEREQKKRDKLKELGIDYDFPGYEAAQSNKTAREEEEEENSEEEKPPQKKKGKTKKRKQSFDEQGDQSPEAAKKEPEKAQSEKKKKKKKKDKKRRKSAP